MGVDDAETDPFHMWCSEGNSSTNWRILFQNTAHGPLWENEIAIGSVRI